MPRFEKSIEVNAPVDRVYDIWSNFENFPRFMQHVKEVTRTGDNNTHWRVEIMGQEYEWEATTTEMRENQRVGWRASGEPGNSGDVTFEPVGSGQTRVKVEISYNLASDTQETVGETLHIPENAVEDDLERFKELAEERSV